MSIYTNVYTTRVVGKYIYAKNLLSLFSFILYKEIFFSTRNQHWKFS